MELLAQTWWNLHDTTRSCKVKNLRALMPLKGSPSLLNPQPVSETTTRIPTQTPTSPTPHAWAMLNLCDSKRSCKVKKSTRLPTQCGHFTVPTPHQLVGTHFWCNLRHPPPPLFWRFNQICVIVPEKAVTRVLKPEICCLLEIVRRCGLRMTVGFSGFLWRRGSLHEMMSVKEMVVPLGVHFMLSVQPPSRIKWVMLEGKFSLHLVCWQIVIRNIIMICLFY